MPSKVQGKPPVVKAKTPIATKQVEVRSLEVRLGEVTDRCEMLAARVGALELGLRKVLEHWPQGRGKLRKDLLARSKRVGKGLDKIVPAADRPSWQKAIDDLIAAID